MGLKKVRSRDSEATRRAVLNAAQHLFAEKGFAGTSMREIASLSGVSQPLIHYHFGSKEGLYSSVKERLVREGLRSILPAHDGSSESETAPSALVRTMYAYLSGNEDLTRMIAWSHLERESIPWPGEEEVHAAAAGYMQRSLRDIPSVGNIDPLIATIMIEALIVYWSQNSHYYASLFDEPLTTVTDRYLDHIARLFFSVETRAQKTRSERRCHP